MIEMLPGAGDSSASAPFEVGFDDSGLAEKENASPSEAAAGVEATEVEGVCVVDEEEGMWLKGTDCAAGSETGMAAELTGAAAGPLFTPAE